MPYNMASVCAFSLHIFLKACRMSWFTSFEAIRHYAILAWFAYCFLSSVRTKFFLSSPKLVQIIFRWNLTDYSNWIICIQQYFPKTEFASEDVKKGMGTIIIISALLFFSYCVVILSFPQCPQVAAPPTGVINKTTINGLKWKLLVNNLIY